MQKVNSSFIMVSTFLVLLILIVTIHYFSCDRKVLSIGSFSNLSLSVAWYEPRLRESSEYHYYLAYPEIYAPDRLGFIYRGEDSE